MTTIIKVLHKYITTTQIAHHTSKKKQQKIAFYPLSEIGRAMMLPCEISREMMLVSHTQNV